MSDDYYSDLNSTLDAKKIFRLDIASRMPLDWALPLYGYVMPVIVIITTVTNSFIVIVLSQKHLRTPTNSVLLAMAITDLMTGWTSIPWFLYYYTLHGYETDQRYGLDAWWCQAHKYFSDLLPSMFHTAAIWLTVFLAVQRYVYVCVPNSVHMYCTPKTTKISILSIFIMSIVSILPEWLGKYRTHIVMGGRGECFTRNADFVEAIGVNVYFSTYHWVRATLHGIPCLLLLIFTWKLGHTIKQAEIRKRSWAVPPEAPFDSRRQSITPKCSTSISGRSLYATNRMLAVICAVFLFLEIPAAILIALSFLFGNKLLPVEMYVDTVNRILIIRNLLIVLTSPIQFGIYCSMSEQFRLTVRQLFSSKLLFVAQAQATFHGGKRYSLILVDVDTIEQKRSIASARSLRYKQERTELIDMNHKRRKIGRQVSFPDEESYAKTRPNGFQRGHRSLRTQFKKQTSFRRPPAKSDAFIVCKEEQDSLLSEPTASTDMSERRLSDARIECIDTGPTSRRTSIFKNSSANPVDHMIII